MIVNITMERFVREKNEATAKDFRLTGKPRLILQGVEPCGASRIDFIADIRCDCRERAASVAITEIESDEMVEKLHL